MDDDWYWEEQPAGTGSVYDMAESDPRNPRLAGLRSVSHAAAVALRKPEPPRAQMGFRINRKPPLTR